MKPSKTSVQSSKVPIRRLHWGCGDIRPSTWINVDIVQGPGIGISHNVLDGLPIEARSIDYISSQHALQQIAILDQIRALRELRRVLKPGGVLRLGLPDLDRAISAYQTGDHDYFWYAWDWNGISGNFITSLLDYNNTRTPFTYEFAEELLRKSGFAPVHRIAYHETTSPYPEIVELGNGEWESFYVEAFKPVRKRTAARQHTT